MSDATDDDEVFDQPTNKSDDKSNERIEVEIDADDDFDEEEFTLETLSEAYASVAGEQSNAESEANDADSDDESADASDVAPDDAEADATPTDNAPAAIDDDAACPLSPESIVESILFVGTPSDVKLTGKKIAALLRDVSPKEVAQIVKTLNARYEKEGSAYRINAQKGVYKMVLDASLNEFQQDYFGRNREAKLAQSAIDVLAVVAYHQPVTREEVDKIRGKSSGSVLNQLLKRQLLERITGDGKPSRKEYVTTDRFLDLFHLEHIEELPQSHEVADIEELAD